MQGIRACVLEVARSTLGIVHIPELDPGYCRLKLKQASKILELGIPYTKPTVSSNMSNTENAKSLLGFVWEA